MVVIDVFAKVRGIAPPSMNAYDADYAAMGRIKRLADTYGVAILLVHHVRKAGSDDFLATVSGTNGIAGAADAVLVLERGRNNADGVLHITGRDVEETDYALSFDPADGAWNLLDGPATDHITDCSPADNQVAPSAPTDSANASANSGSAPARPDRPRCSNSPPNSPPPHWPGCSASTSKSPSNGSTSPQATGPTTPPTSAAAPTLSIR
jgi:hypothetical protein